MWLYAHYLGTPFWWLCSDTQHDTGRCRILVCSHNLHQRMDSFHIHQYLWNVDNTILLPHWLTVIFACRGILSFCTWRNSTLQSLRKGAITEIPKKDPICFKINSIWEKWIFSKILHVWEVEALILYLHIPSSTEDFDRNKILPITVNLCFYRWTFAEFQD